MRPSEKAEEKAAAKLSVHQLCHLRAEHLCPKGSPHSEAMHDWRGFLCVLQLDRVVLASAAWSYVAVELGH